MSEITRNQAIQIVEDIRTAISAGSVTNTLEARVMEYCVVVLGRRIEETGQSGYIENLPDIVAFLAGFSSPTTLRSLLNAINEKIPAEASRDNKLADKAFVTALANALQNAVDTINGKIPAEASSSNQMADKAFVTALTTALQNAVDTINANIGNGYVYAGIATPSGTPVSGKVFYLARQAGQYTNFGGLTVTEGINILKRNGSEWSQEQLVSMADIYKNPLIGYYECDTAGDTAAKAVTAAGYVLPATGGSVKIKMANRNTVANATLNINSTGAKPLYYNGQRAGVGNTWDTNEIIEVFYDGANYQAYNVAGSNGDGVFDISAYNLTDGKPTPYEDLETALGPDGEHVPQSLHKGGVSVKFMQKTSQSSDKKYVQYRLMATSFSTNEANWQGVDEEPIYESDNLIKSKGVFDSVFINGILNISVCNGSVDIPQSYSELSVALDNVPIEYQGRCTSVKFLNSTTNKYEQWSLLKDSWSYNVSYWQRSDFINIVDDTQFIDAEIDKNSKLLSSYDINGKKTFYGDAEVKGNLEVDGNITAENIESSFNTIDEHIKIGEDNNNDSVYPSTIYNIEDSTSFVDAVTDVNNKLIESTNNEGQKTFYGGINISNFEINEVSESGNFLAVETDKNGKVHHALYDTGIHLFPAGIKTTENLRFILMTDNHYDAPVDGSVGERTDGVTADERTQMIFNMIKAEQKKAPIDFILHTGDVVWDKDGEPLLPSEDQQTRIKLFKERYLSQIDIPFVCCVGNHDGFVLSETWRDVFYHGRQFSFETKNFYFICLDMYHNDDSETSASYPALTLASKMEWLNEEAEKCHKLNKEGVICYHHINPSDTQTLHDWMNSNGFHLIFRGHTHVPTFNTSNGITTINAGWFANRLEYSPYIEGQEQDPVVFVNDGGYLSNIYNWGIGLVEIKNGEITYTSIKPEWRFLDTAYWQNKAIEDGVTVSIASEVLGDNHDGYFAATRTENEITTVDTYSSDSADFVISELKNNSSNDGQYTEVPSVPTV